MPDKRTHCGKHPQDDTLFSESARSQLQQAVSDMSWLLSHGYANKSSLKLVGDRFDLLQRQRMAVMRCACSDDEQAARFSKRADPADLRHQPLLVDGYNVITTVETALGGGVVLKARDGTLRDIAGMHGTFRKVHETIPAINLIGRAVEQLNVSECLWYLDSPVSNSGRLKTLLLQLGKEKNWNFHVDLLTNPDNILSESKEIVATSDSIILNRCQRWFDLTGYVIDEYINDVFIVDFYI